MSERMNNKKLLTRIPFFTLLLALNPLLLAGESLGQMKSGKASLNPTVADSAVRPLFAGMVTGTGELLINEDRIPNTGSIISGSTVSTGPDADAMIDLGALGHIQLRPNTTVKVLFSADSCQIIMERCGSFTQFVPNGVSAQVKLTLPKLAEVSSTRGEVSVAEDAGPQGRAAQYRIKAGKRKKIYNASDIAANGESSYTVNCCQCCMVDRYHR